MVLLVGSELIDGIRRAPDDVLYVTEPANEVSSVSSAERSALTR